MRQFLENSHTHAPSGLLWCHVSRGSKIHGGNGEKVSVCFGVKILLADLKDHGEDLEKLSDAAAAELFDSDVRLISPRKPSFAIWVAADGLLTFN